MIAITVDASTVISPNDLTGQLHGLGSGIPPSLYAALNPRYWRVDNHNYPTTFNQCFATSPNPPLPIYIFSQWYGTNVVGAEQIFMPYSGGSPNIAGLNSSVDTFWTSVGSSLPAGSIVDIVNEPDNSVFWSPVSGPSGGGQDNFNLFFGTVAGRLKYHLSTQAVCGPSVTKYTSKFWIVGTTPHLGLCNYLAGSIPVVPLDYASWHAEGSAPSPTLPSDAATDIHDAQTSIYGAYKTSLSMKGLMINEYGSSAASQWLNPAMMVGYVVQMENQGLAVATRTCWTNDQQVATCYDGKSMSQLLNTNGKSIPMGIYEVYRRLGRSKGSRLSTSYTDTTIDAFSYMTPDRIVLVIGAWGGPATAPLPGLPTDSFQVTVNNLPMGFPSDGQFATGVLQQLIQVGTNPQLIVQGPATVRSHSVTVTVPAIKYGQSVVIELGALAAPRFLGFSSAGRTRVV